MSERQTMTRECTCLGTCKGPEGLALGWRCALGRSPECRDNRRRMHEGEVTGDVVKTAIDRAVERFGDRGDGLFNAAGFGVALMELAGLKGVIDGTLVRAILSGRADVAMELDASHFRRIVGLCRDPRCRIEREHTATLHNLPGGELNGRVAPAAPAPAVEGEPPAHQMTGEGDCKASCNGCRWRRDRGLPTDWEWEPPKPAGEPPEITLAEATRALCDGKDVEYLPCSRESLGWTSLGSPEERWTVPGITMLAESRFRLKPRPAPALTRVQELVRRDWEDNPMVARAMRCVLTEFVNDMHGSPFNIAGHLCDALLKRWTGKGR